MSEQESTVLSNNRSERCLTVSRLYQPRVPQYDGGPTIERKVPFLRLRGVWLESAGFECGDRVRVEVANGRLVLTPMDSEG